MRSLFIKIFLSFWLAMLVMAAGLMLAQRYWGGGPELPAPSAMAAYAAEAQRLIARGERAAIARWLAALNRESEVRFVLIDAEANPLGGRRLPPPLREPILSALQGELPRRRERQLAVEAVDVAPPVYLAALGPPPHRWRDAPLGLRLAIVLGASGMVSLLLAAFLSRPIRRVRHAAQRLAAGDLQARVEGPQGRDEIAELGRDFNTMAERLQGLLEAQAQLMRDVSHELRSPLHRLQVALELARRDAGSAAEASLDRIELEAERLNELVGQVLALSRLEAGAARPAPEPLDLAALVLEIVEDAEFEAGEGRKVIYQGPDSLNVFVDPALLRSAVENVVRNALRHTPPHTRVEVELNDGEPLEVRVRDYGEGVPPAELARIFQPFVRVSAARERASGGHGLGLAIARRALRLHGGDIAAANASGGGLEVALRLPRRGLAPVTGGAS